MLKPTKIGATDPWHKLTFDESGIFSMNDLPKIFRKVFDVTDAEKNPVQSRVPAINMHSSFLPYNYYMEETTKDGVTTLAHIFQIACAGYAKENIKVSRKDDNLIVNFEQPENKTVDGVVEKEDGSIVKTIIGHSQLTAKTGKISWFLKNLSKSDVKSCSVKNGILTIRIEERPIVDETETIEIQ